MTANELHQLNQGLIDISMEDVQSTHCTCIFCLFQPGCLWSQQPSQRCLFSTAHRGLYFHGTDDKQQTDYDLAALFAFLWSFKIFWCSANTWSTLLYNRLTQKAIVNGQSEGAIKESKRVRLCRCWPNESMDQKDNYKNVKSGDQYTIHGIDSTWALYTSDYAQAPEPNWHKLRPIVLKKVLQNFLAPARPGLQ